MKTFLRLWPLHLAVLVVAVVSQFIGVQSIPLGFGTILLLPMLYAFVLCLLVYLLDDRIHSAEHIEQLLGLSVLGDIPDCNMIHQKGRYGYYRGKPYGKYGYGPYGHSQKSKKKGGA